MAYATVTGAALTNHRYLLFILLSALYAFVNASISIPSWILLHGNPKGIPELIHQTSCAAKPGFKYPELLKYPEYSGFFPSLS